MQLSVSALNFCFCIQFSVPIPKGCRDLMPITLGVKQAVWGMVGYRLSDLACSPASLFPVGLQSVMCVALSLHQTYLVRPFRCGSPSHTPLPFLGTWEIVPLFFDKPPTNFGFIASHHAGIHWGWPSFRKSSQLCCLGRSFMFWFLHLCPR